jgi:chromosome segregation ATPase
MEVAVIATIVTTLGGIITLIINGVFKSTFSRQDELVKYRADMQADINRKNKALDTLRAERDATVNRMQAEKDEITSDLAATSKEYARLEARYEYCQGEIAELDALLKECRTKLIACETELHKGHHHGV